MVNPIPKFGGTTKFVRSLSQTLTLLIKAEHYILIVVIS